MRILLIAGALMTGVLLTQDAVAQGYGLHRQSVKIHRRAEFVKVFSLGNTVRNSFQNVKFGTGQAVDGVIMILHAPFVRHPEQLPLFKKYRYYRPLYVPSRWERVR